MDQTEPAQGFCPTWANGPVMRTFTLAPMNALIWVLTLIVLAIPLVFLVAALNSGVWQLHLVNLVLLAIYASVWVWWRPGLLVVSEQALELRFPGRRLTIPRSDIADCRLLTPAQFKQEFGRAARVGAGGLWGGFGWLWTHRKGWLEFYISRTDGYLLVERRSACSLLLTPNDPAAMAEALGATQAP